MERNRLSAPIEELQEDALDFASDLLGIAERLAGLALPKDTPRETQAGLVNEVRGLCELAQEIAPDCMDELDTEASDLINSFVGHDI